MYGDRSTEQSIILVPKSEAGSGHHVVAPASLFSSSNMGASLFATHYQFDEVLNLWKSGFIVYRRQFRTRSMTLHNTLGRLGSLPHVPSSRIKRSEPEGSPQISWCREGAQGDLAVTQRGPQD